MKADKPLRLPMNIVAMLRGQVGYPKEDEPLCEIAISAYTKGFAGKAYTPAKKYPGIDDDVVQLMDRFLKAAHLQGRVDAGLEATT